MVAIDGSKSSMDAVAYAIVMARKNNAQLIVLHVLFSPLGYEYSSGKFGDETIPSPIKQIFGAAKDEAEEHNIDLIVVGTRGRSGFTKLLLGSVASAVVTYAHCPVLLLR
jgi:nucleotide-binding universal stress UspA family protein